MHTFLNEHLMLSTFDFAETRKTVEGTAASVFAQLLLIIFVSQYRK